MPPTSTRQEFRERNFCLARIFYVKMRCLPVLPRIRYNELFSQLKWNLACKVSPWTKYIRRRNEKNYLCSDWTGASRSRPGKAKIMGGNSLWWRCTYTGRMAKICGYKTVGRRMGEFSALVSQFIGKCVFVIWGCFDVWMRRFLLEKYREFDIMTSVL